MGVFQYDDIAFEKQLGQRESQDMVILENGARYEGEWMVGTTIR